MECRICDWCGSSFETNHHAKKYCSDPCMASGRNAYGARYRATNRDAQNEYQRRYRIVNASRRKAQKKAAYRSNAEQVKSERRAARQLLKDTDREALRLRDREESQRKRNAKPELYRIIDNDKGRRRRALKANAATEEFKTVDVFERDNWICQLCQRPVDPTLTKPNVWRASLDHIIPLARGGAHVLANVQLAHLTCNVSKQARI